MAYVLRGAGYTLGTILLLQLFSGCALLREVVNLEEVEFAIEDVTDAQLAGIDLSQIDSYEDLRPSHIAQLTGALASNDLPFRFDLHLLVQNPESNIVSARFVQLDWTLFIEEQETVSGTIEEDIVISPGETAEVVTTIELDLLRFYRENIHDLVELARAAAGQGGEPISIMLRATPTVETPLGPIRYPEPITIVERELDV